ncbi:tumor protein p63-regulated gene 1-like protein [Heptranchias perlo]|uniref:tumor protein p63-regulated gene 1-like protein n=1 Tax=Heptranchias perlo TaxID=212740 RepID=UPI00355A1C17
MEVAGDPSEFQAVDLGRVAGDQAPNPGALELDEEPRLDRVVLSEERKGATEMEEAGGETKSQPEAQSPAQRDVNPPTPTPALRDYMRRKFFVLRPGTFDQALTDLKALINHQEDGALQSTWLLAEVDHWNNERERIVLISEKTLLICKYDFMVLRYQQCRRIPLNYIDRIIHGEFSFPERAVTRRDGKGLRVHWDKLREASFVSRWNPWSADMPYTTFTEHPVKGATETFTNICQLENFKAQLAWAVQKAYQMDPVPGRANGVLILDRPILIDTYVGIMSLINNQNKLGYSLARGSVGF